MDLQINEAILDRTEISSNSKLRYLKQYTTGTAHQLIKSFHLGEELEDAIKVLEETFGKSENIFRECLRKSRSLPPVSTERNTKASRNFLTSIITIVSTLKAYNFDEFKDDIDNSTILVDIESKIPYNTYYEGEKLKKQLTRDKENITMKK